MTNEQILKKAIEKAVENGYKFYGFLDIKDERYWTELIVSEKVYFIIFSHDFAKAFWGEKEIKDSAYPKIMGRFIKEWEWQIMMLALEEKPLKYLEKFL